LLVDADRKLTEPIATKSLKPIAWQACQIFERKRRIKNFEALPALPFKYLESSDGLDSRK
jgi:hypothetical protein